MANLIFSMNPVYSCRFTYLISDIFAVNSESCSPETSTKQDGNDSDCEIFRVKRRPSVKLQNKSIDDACFSDYQGHQVF